MEWSEPQVKILVVWLVSRGIVSTPGCVTYSKSVLSGMWTSWLSTRSCTESANWSFRTRSCTEKLYNIYPWVCTRHCHQYYKWVWFWVCLLTSVGCGSFPACTSKKLEPMHTWLCDLHSKVLDLLVSVSKSDTLLNSSLPTLCLMKKKRNKL